MKTKGIVTVLFVFGTAMLAVGLVLAISAAPEASRTMAYTLHTTGCADCHATPHADWQVAPHNLMLTDYNPTPSACMSCHEMTPETLSDMQAELPPTQARLLALRHQLAQVYEQYPSWQVTDIDKPTEQVISEEVEAILTLIEADGDWGFHSDAYVNAQLDDAQALLNTLYSLNR